MQEKRDDLPRLRIALIDETGQRSKRPPVVVERVKK
jgi:hypothetical protein